jgi:hypothetical protein
MLGHGSICGVCLRTKVVVNSWPSIATTPHQQERSANISQLQNLRCAVHTPATQIESLVQRVCELVRVVAAQATSGTPDVTPPLAPLVLDLGAGKALFTRAVYEALGRRVAVVALDCRDGSDGHDLFYDPPPPHEALSESSRSTAALYTRVVADLGKHGQLAKSMKEPLRAAGATRNSVVAVTKHLCGGFTDSTLMELCTPPLNDFVGAACLAPCCHQKILKKEYCNMPFLIAAGFCSTHTGVRGGDQDIDFRTLGMLIQMSRATSLQEWEYAKSPLLQLLGFERVRSLGRKSRRLLEEGRMRYLRDRGFDARLVRYCDEATTSDNLAIICTKRASSQTDDATRTAGGCPGNDERR